jgi:hypothetical protein
MPEKNQVMNRQHPRWNEFAEKLCGTTPLEGCNHTTQDAEAVLVAMGGLDVDASLAYMRSKGGYCDCEIIMNVIMP